MPTAELHIQVQILSPRLRFWAGKLTAGAGAENAPVAHLPPASFAIRKGQAELSLSVSRQAFGGIQRHRMNKSPQNQNNSYVLPQRQGISGELPSFWGFLLLPLMCVRGQNLSGLFWETHANTYMCCPGGTRCWMSNFPSFLGRAVSGRSCSRSAGPYPGESPIAIPSLADRPGWLHSLQPSSKAPQ